MVLQEPLDREVRLDNEVMLDLLDHLAHVEKQDLKAHKDHPDLMVNPDSKEALVVLVPLVLQDLLVNQAKEENPAFKDQADNLDHEARVDLLAKLDQEVKQVHQDLEEHEDQGVKLDLLDLQV